MKIDRLLGIITLLLQKDKMTAPQLANHFEVSRRTINRDIEDICMAGIPLVTKQGKYGGISIQEGFKLDKNVLTKDELVNIIIGLKGINSVSSTSETEMLLNKLTPHDDALISLKDNIIIDLASHYKNSLSEKIGIIKSAICENSCIQFMYYSNKGEHVREIEPYSIVFKWSAWYVFGYCLKRDDFRMFKLNRLWDLEKSRKTFIKRKVPNNEIDFDSHFTDEYMFEAEFHCSVKYRLIDEYGRGSFEEKSDGKLFVKMNYTHRDYIISWLLSFGDKVKVLSPHELIDDIKNQVHNIKDFYE